MKTLPLISLLLMAFFCSSVQAQLQVAAGPSVSSGSPSAANFLYKDYKIWFNTNQFNNGWNADPAAVTAYSVTIAHMPGSTLFNKALNTCAHNTPNYTFAIMNGYTNAGLIYQSHEPSPTSPLMTQFNFLVVCSD